MNTVSIGDIQLIPVSDGKALPVSPSWPFPDVPHENWKDHGYSLNSEGLHTSNFGGFILRIREEIILVDTGLGPRPPKIFGNSPRQLPSNLKDIGIDPTEITSVFFTHLHFDHVGWALNEQGDAPFFKNARYIVSKSDWDYWGSCQDPSRTDHTNGFSINFEPLIDYGVLDFIEGEKLLTRGVKTLPTPGHTPGHMSLLLDSQGAAGVVTGDVFHSAAQFAEPDWSHRADVDPNLGRETRKLLLERLIPGVTIAVGHLEHGSNIGTVAIIDSCRYWRGFSSEQKA